MAQIGKKTWLVERNIKQYTFVSGPETAEEAVKEADRRENTYGQSRHARQWAEDLHARDTHVREIKRMPARRAGKQQG